MLAGSLSLAQENGRTSDHSTAGGQENSGEQTPRQPKVQETTLEKIRDLPIAWLIGPYIPPQGPLIPLTKAQRTEVYFDGTFLTAGSYFARLFSAGIDQARGSPYQWGGGMKGYGRRFASNYGQFVIASTFHEIGNGALGYESRYDLCRCTGFWPRTKHAVARNFYTYNRTERELRPQVPLYAGAFSTGVLYNSWLPGHQNIWRGGAFNVLAQAGIGSGYNFVSEFALDILHGFGLKKDVNRGGMK